MDVSRFRPPTLLSAEKVIGQIGGLHGDASVVMPLLAKLQDSKTDWAVLTEVAWALGKIPDKRSIQPLYDLEPGDRLCSCTARLRASARQALEVQQTKTEMVYRYLTGPRFRHRVEAIVEAFSSMQEDLDKEKKAITKQWAKREEQIERVMQATARMYGDLQGIAGKTIQEIERLGISCSTLPPMTRTEGPNGRKKSGWATREDRVYRTGSTKGSA
jgi:hypothetical protein